MTRTLRLTKQELEAIREALGHTLADEYDGETPIEAFHSAREKIDKQLLDLRVNAMIERSKNAKR